MHGASGHKGLDYSDPHLDLLLGYEWTGIYEVAAKLFRDVA